MKPYNIEAKEVKILLLNIIKWLYTNCMSVCLTGIVYCISRTERVRYKIGMKNNCWDVCTSPNVAFELSTTLLIFLVGGDTKNMVLYSAESDDNNKLTRIKTPKVPLISLYEGVKSPPTNVFSLIVLSNFSIQNYLRWLFLF